jgi:LysM repeat protein
MAHPYSVVFAKEETARLSLKKTAISDKKLQPYVVKKGEWLFEIMRSQMGITSHRFSIIKKLNPQLKNLNKIYPGQIIMLPEKDPTRSISEESTDPATSYMVKKGDYISRIVVNQLHVKPRDVFKAVNQIRRLNPDIKNANMIYPGQVLQLPRRSIFITQKDDKSSVVDSQQKIIEKTGKKVMPPEIRLDIIRHIIGRMNGSLVTVGKHYIPITQMGQVTIDCSMIPVAELEDGSTVLVDFTDRVPNSLKKVIQANWKNYHVVKADSTDSIVAILRKIINASNAYAIVQGTKPYTVGKNPSLQFALDWVISKKAPGDGKAYTQGLIFLADNSHMLPGPMIDYAEKNGLIVSAIVDGQGLITASNLKYTIPEAPVLSAGEGRDLAYALLATLNYTPIKDTEVRIFDPAKDGFNLSITADLLVKKGDRQVMIHSKRLPQQFVDNLKNRGIDIIFLEEGDNRKSIIGKTLHALNIPYSADTFIFSEPQNTSKPRASITFPAFKVSGNKGFVYLIDFNMDRDLYGYLHSKQEVNFVRF